MPALLTVRVSARNDEERWRACDHDVLDVSGTSVRDVLGNLDARAAK